MQPLVLNICLYLILGFICKLSDVTESIPLGIPPATSRHKRETVVSSCHEISLLESPLMKLVYYIASNLTCLLSPLQNRYKICHACFQELNVLLDYAVESLCEIDDLKLLK